MTSRRQLKAAEAIREVVASAIVTELRDPRVKGVTVISVKVTPDMREAKVAVSIMGDEKQEKLSLRGLKNSAGFLQQQIARRIDTRHVPKLEFEVDRGLQNSMAVTEILAKIRREKESEQQNDLDSDSEFVEESPTDGVAGITGDANDSIGEDQSIPTTVDDLDSADPANPHPEHPSPTTNKDTAS